MTGVLRPVTEVTIATAFAFGINLALLGCLKLWLSRALNLGEGHVRTLLILHNLAWLPFVFLSGVLVDNLGVQPVIVLASAATAIGAFVLSCQPNTPAAFASVLLSGAGSAGLCIGGVVLMTEAFFPHNAVASLNAGLLFVALGALIAPPLTDLLIRLIGYRRGVALIALGCLIPGLIAALTGQEDLRFAAANSDESTIVPMHDSLWLACLVIFLYSPLEASISNWAATHLANPGPQVGRTSRYVTGFWAAFLLSRLVVTILLCTSNLGPLLQTGLLVVPALLAAVVLGNMAGSTSASRAGKGLLLVGFCLGPILPTLIGMLFEQLGTAQLQGYGAAGGLLFAAGSFGSLLLVPVIRLTTRREAPQSALRAPLAGALLLSAAALVFGLAAQQSDAPPSRTESTSTAGGIQRLWHRHATDTNSTR
jgi:fucose permease